MKSLAPLLLFFFFFLLLPPPLRAQRTVIHPPVCASDEGTARSAYPLAAVSTLIRMKTNRWLQVHDRLLKKPGKIRALSFRREGLYFYQIFPSFGVTLELSLSTARTTSRTLSPYFAANHGADRTVVIPKTTIYFKSTLSKPALPYPGFDYTLPFSTKPFSLAAGKNLCWEADVYGNTLGSNPWKDMVVFDATQGRPRTLVRLYGKGSFAPGRTRPMYPDFQIDWSYPPASVWTMTAYLYRGPAGGSAFLLFSRAGDPAGIPLPGGQGYLHLDPAGLLLIAGPAPITFNGDAGLGRPAIPPIPAYPSLYGAKVYGQFLCVDAGAKALYASRAAILQFPRKWPDYYGPRLGHCFTNDLNSPKAWQVRPGEGLVTKFLVQ